MGTGATTHFYVYAYKLYVGRWVRDFYVRVGEGVVFCVSTDSFFTPTYFVEELLGEHLSTQSETRSWVEFVQRIKFWPGINKYTFRGSERHRGSSMVRRLRGRGGWVGQWRCVNRPCHVRVPTDGGLKDERPKRRREDPRVHRVRCTENGDPIPSSVLWWETDLESGWVPVQGLPGDRRVLLRKISKWSHQELVPSKTGGPLCTVTDLCENYQCCRSSPPLATIRSSVFGPYDDV